MNSLPTTAGYYWRRAFITKRTFRPNGTMTEEEINPSYKPIITIVEVVLEHATRSRKKPKVLLIRGHGYIEIISTLNPEFNQFVGPLQEPTWPYPTIK